MTASARESREDSVFLAESIAKRLTSGAQKSHKSDEGTYAGVVADNIEKIRTAVQKLAKRFRALFLPGLCDPPPRPYDGGHSLDPRVRKLHQFCIFIATQLIFTRIRILSKIKGKVVFQLPTTRSA